MISHEAAGSNPAETEAETSSSVPDPEPESARHRDDELERPKTGVPPAPERARRSQFLANVVVVFVGLGVAGVVTVVTLVPFDTLDIYAPLLVGILAMIVGAFVKLATDEQEQREQNATVAVEEAAAQVQEANMDPAALFEFNRKDIERYHIQTRGQASKSFTMSLITMSIGFIVLVAGAAIAIRLPATEIETKIVTAVLTVTGTALASYIGRTFIRAHERALIQLNYYFQQPVVMSYVLTAERLVAQKLGKSDKRDDVVLEIIREVLSAARGSVERAANLLDPNPGSHPASNDSP